MSVSENTASFGQLLKYFCKSLLEKEKSKHFKSKPKSAKEQEKVEVCGPLLKQHERKFYWPKKVSFPNCWTLLTILTIVKTVDTYVMFLLHLSHMWRMICVLLLIMISALTFIYAHTFWSFIGFTSMWSWENMQH